ncbi:MAG: hypothetical protein ACFFD7_03135 [Candidatus Thorarchaeota archaeon]
MRKIYREIGKYDILDSVHEIKLEPEEIDLLFERKCLKDKSTTTLEIDIFSENKRDHEYILGECTFISQRKIAKKIKCFFAKVDIITKHLINYCERMYQVKPKFHIIIISMSGFPSKEIVKQIEGDSLDLSRNRILNIEYINYDQFKKLAKENRVKVDKYKKVLE